ncbi:BTAD domain-containing putative transcriptional regulator [Actinomadura sp. 6N118]|uniref:BTAD domain-containing putative transcriptional regulator n=1 Tax=Actinomadura sp. 6N118 TaxID=3375151 RepID=UPI0037A09DCB
MQVPSGATSAAPQGAEDADEGVSAPTIAGYSALTAAGLLSLLALKRITQQRRRRPGHRIRLPEAMSDTEMDLRAYEEPASVQLLDTAVRSLSARLGETGGVLPALHGARVTGTAVELLLAEPADPIPPFAADTGRQVWNLDRTSDALLTSETLSDIPAPYPSLVTLGVDADFNHILIDLEAAGAITLTGERGHICEVLTGLALEMATCPWADHIQVTCVAFAEELPHVLGTGRLRYVSDLDQVLVDFEARAREVADVLADADVESVRQARTDHVADDAWTPQIILSSTPFTPDEVARLSALVTGGASSNLAAVVAAGGDSPLPGRWRLDATPDQTVHVEPLGSLTLQRVTADQFHQLLDDLATASDDNSVPDPAWRDVPPEPDPVGWSAETPTRPNPPPFSVQSSDATQDVTDAAHGASVSESIDTGDLRVAGEPLAPGGPDSDLIDVAAEIVMSTPSADAFTLQRGLRIPYAQAARLIAELETRSHIPGSTAGHVDEARKDSSAAAAGTTSPAWDREDAADLLHLDPDAPEIRVLGRVEIAGRDVNDVEVGKRNLLPELAAFLHLKSGCSAEEVSRALGGPRGPWSQSTRASNMSRLRTWFGRDSQGRLYVPTQTQGRLYTLSGVRCDWDRFQALGRRGLAHRVAGDRLRAVKDLQAALSIVRGQPFAGSGPSSYVWAEHVKQLMISVIVDVTHALAVTLTETGNAPAARTAIAKGLEIEPGSELLFRDLIRAEHRAGNMAGIDEAVERLILILYELELEMEPETAQLLEQLRPARRRVGSG